MKKARKPLSYQQLAAYLFSASVGLSLFGFQLIGALADTIGMETPRPISLALRLGTGFIFLLVIASSRWWLASQFSRLALLQGFAFLIFYGLHLLIKSGSPEYPLRLTQNEYLGFFLTFVLLPFFGSCFIRFADYFNYLLKFLLVLTTVILIVYLSQFGKDAFRNMRYMPFAGVNPIGIGYAGLSAFFLSAWSLMSHRPSAFMRAVLVAIMIAGIILALLSGQRQVMLSFVVGIMVSFNAIHGLGRRAAGLRRLFLFTLFLGIFAGLTMSEHFENTVTRLDRTLDNVDSGSELRMDQWYESFQIAFDNPLLGGPIENPSTRYYPHNLVIEAFMVTGLIGGLLFLTFFVSNLYMAYHVVSSPHYGWVGIIHYQFAVSSLLSGSLYAGVWYWLSAALVIAAYSLLDEKMKTINAYSRGIDYGRL